MYNIPVLNQKNENKSIKTGNLSGMKTWYRFYNITEQITHICLPLGKKTNTQKHTHTHLKTEPSYNTDTHSWLRGSLVTPENVHNILYVTISTRARGAATSSSKATSSCCLLSAPAVWRQRHGQRGLNESFLSNLYNAWQSPSDYWRHGRSSKPPRLPSGGWLQKKHK